MSRGWSRRRAPPVVELCGPASRATRLLLNDTSVVDILAPLIDSAPRTFFGVPSLRDLEMLDAQVAFLGVPYDGGTPQPGIPTGQRAGPAAAREATVAQFSYPRSAGAGEDPGAEGWYDVEADRDYLVGVTMADVGDVAIQGSDTEANYGRITRAARGIVERGALMVAIGGDHSISYPLGRGMEPLGEFDVVHVERHRFLAIDARAHRASQLRRSRWATSLDVLERGAGDVVRETIPKTEALYVSIDLDVLDSSIAPGHSLQEPGGLSYRQLRAMLAEVARRGRVIGFDVVELNPARDPSGATPRVATWIVTHFLSEIFDQQR